MIQVASAAGDRSGPLQVLVCEHEAHIGLLIQVNLERQGCAVTFVRDGFAAIELLEAMDVLEEGRLDSVILSSSLIGRDGYEILEWIRAHERFSKTRVIMMVPKEERAEWEQRPIRADMYVSKPFNPRDLLP